MRINKSLIAFTPTSGGGSGSVTSVALSAPTGFVVSGSPITSSGTLALAFASGYSLPTTIKQSNWDDAYTWVTNFPVGTEGQLVKFDAFGDLEAFTPNFITNPMTSLGDMIYGNAVGLPLRLAPNTTTTKKYLSMTGDGTNGDQPFWDTITGFIGGSGTTNYIPKFTASGTIGNSSLTINTFSGTNEVLKLTSSNASSFELYNGTSTLTLQNFSNDVSLIYQRSTITNSILYYNGSSASDRYVSLQTEGVDRFIVKQTGDIGIGTSTPSQKLHVYNTAPIVLVESSTNTGGQFRAKNTVGEYVKGIEGSTAGGWMDYDVTNSGFITLYRPTSSGFYSIYTNAIERFTILGNGNIGINQTNPSEKLEVSGNVRISDALAIGTAPDTNLPFKILKNINSTVGIRFENTSTSSLAFTAVQFGSDVTGGTAFCNFVYCGSGVTTNGAFIAGGTTLLNTGVGGLNIGAISQPIRFFTSTGTGTERFRIKNDGQVRFIPLASAPGNAEAGDMYYNSTDNKHYGYNGTSWNALY